MTNPAPPLELGTGLLQYGNFVFPNAIKAKVSANPVNDSTNRFTKYVIHRLQIETVLYPGVDENLNATPFFDETAPTADGLDGFDAMDGVRRVLSTRGNQLIFRTKGYGSFEINTITQDVLAGPNPELIAWEPIGDNFAVRVVWGVEVTISECSEGVQTSRFTEHSYSIGFGIDIHGLTTRTISGHYEIVLAIRPGGGLLRSAATISNNADQRRELAVNFDVPTGFGRTRQDYVLNDRRDRMDFTIVDTEYAADDQNRMPKGVVSIDVKQSTRSEGSLLSNRWNTTISGTIAVAKGQPRFLAWIAFLNIVSSRIKRAKDEGNIPQDSMGNPETHSADKTRSGKIVILRSLTITEDIYGRSMTFSITWTSFSTLNNIIKAAGFFTQIPGATERGQITSLIAPNQAWTSRGQKRLAWGPGEPLIGLCESQFSLDSGTTARKSNETIGKATFRTEKPAAADSWICWEAKVIEEKQTNRYYTLPANGLLAASETSFKIAVDAQNRTTVGKNGSGSQNKTQIPPIHQSGGHGSRLTFVGSAARLGYAIPEIHLLKYAGADVSPVGTQTQVNLDPVDAGGVLLFRSTWVKEYVFVTQPNDTKKSISTDPSPTAVNSNCEAGFNFQQR